jgi:hypothetical protein
MVKKAKNKLPDIHHQDPLVPIDITGLGNGEDCFGVGYDLSTKECKLCGDSELCALKMSQNLNITRKELNEKNHYKDLDILEDIKAIKKHMRKLIRSGNTRKEIIEECCKKYEVPSKDLRKIYREIEQSTNPIILYK